MTDEEVFQQAIKLADSKREEFFSETCDDEEQRERVERLVSAHQRDDSLLDTEAPTPASDTSSTPHVPTTIGDFEILRELGRGGMGVVYEARQKSLNRKVALKVLSSGLGLSSKAILRFRREAEAAGKLHHTNIVPIYTTGEDRGIHFYAMELIDGPSLDQVIDDLKNGRESYGLSFGPSKGASRSDLSGLDATGSGSSTFSGAAYFDQVATMVADVADALDHAHEHGVIHRDVKPSNVLLAPDGRLSINDFGLARMLEQPGMTMSGEFVGSPLYMSQEQITAGRAPLDHRTDIYSLGAMLYELLTLKPPFPGDTRDQVIAQILHKEPASPRKQNRRVPVDLETICMKAIEKDPDRRYQTAKHLANDLRAYVNRNAISARRIGLLGRTAKWAKRNRALTTVSGVGFLMLFAMGVLLLQGRSQQQKERLDAMVEQFLFECLSEDVESAEKSLAKIHAAGRSDVGLLRLLDATLLVHRGERDDYAKAIDLLENEEFGRRYVAAFAILTYAHLMSGDEVLYWENLESLRRRRANSWIDRVYKGQALTFGDPFAAVETLEVANRESPRVGTQIMLASALGEKSKDMVDPIEALDVGQRGLSLMQAALISAPEYATAHAEAILSHLAVASACRRMEDTSAAESHLELAVAGAIEFVQRFNFLTFEAALAFEAANDSEGLIRLYEDQLDSDLNLLGPDSDLRLAIAYYRRGRLSEARELCEMSQGVESSFVRFLEVLIRADEFTSQREVHDVRRQLVFLFSDN